MVGVGSGSLWHWHSRGCVLTVLCPAQSHPPVVDVCRGDPEPQFLPCILSLLPLAWDALMCPYDFPSYL